MNAINPVARIGTIVNLLLTFLEKISDENIWKNILGERLVNLGQKYFGNDFVALSLAFYIARKYLILHRVKTSTYPASIS